MYSIVEFSRQIGVSVPTLRLWHSKGKLVPESVTAGGHRRYSEAQVKEYLTAHKIDIAYCNESEHSLMCEYLDSLNLDIGLITDNSTMLARYIVGRELRSLIAYSTSSFKDFELIKFLCKHYDIDLKIVSDSAKEGGDDNVWD